MTSYTYGSGTVTQFLWSFANAAISTSSLTPITVKFLTNAYGLANLCSVGVTHLDSNGLVCSSDTASKLTIPVNVIKPLLQLNTAATNIWSSDDTAFKDAQTEYQTYFFVGHGTNFAIPAGSGDMNIGLPYEYIYSITSPANSGVLTNLMTIYETTIETDVYCTSSITGTPPVTNQIPMLTNTFYTNGWYPNPGFANCTAVGAPTNPTMYACDVPTVDMGYFAGELVAGPYTSVAITKKLVSYPLYNDSSNAIDSSVSTTNKLIYNCSTTNTNGHGAYSWSFGFLTNN